MSNQDNINKSIKKNILREIFIGCELQKRLNNNETLRFKNGIVNNIISRGKDGFYSMTRIQENNNGADIQAFYKKMNPQELGAIAISSTEIKVEEVAEEVEEVEEVEGSEIIERIRRETELREIESGKKLQDRLNNNETLRFKNGIVNIIISRGKDGFYSMTRIQENNNGADINVCYKKLSCKDLGTIAISSTEIKLEGVEEVEEVEEVEGQEI